MAKPLLTWNEEVYSVGIRKMDDQHKVLIGLINALQTQKSGKDKAFIEKVFATLVQYTVNHFGDEEKILKRMNYPDFTIHHKQHEKFIKTVSDLKSLFDKQGEASRAKALENLTTFLAEWITHHILVEDKAYGKYLAGE